MLIRNLLFALLVISCSSSQFAFTREDNGVDESEQIVHVNAFKRPPALHHKLIPRHVLVVGDSEACVVGLNRDVITKFNDDNEQPHDDVTVECKTSTRVQYWAGDGNFLEALSKHPNTDVVLVYLGTNHWYSGRQVPDVKPIIDVVVQKSLDCVWVGNTTVRGRHWPINGILHVAVEPTCTYFDTEAADIQLRDDAHPTRSGAVKWINAVWPLIQLKYEDEYD
jgi:hypothetical protein